MRSSVEVEERVRAIVLAELKDRLERRVLPHLCMHNRRQPLDHRRSVLGEPNRMYNRIAAGVEDGVVVPVAETIGLCMLGAEDPAQWGGTICEEPLDAQRCPYFVHRQSRADVYQEFVANLADPVWVEVHLPVVHSLLWVLSLPLQVEEPTTVFGRVWAKMRHIWALFSPRTSPGFLARASVYLPPLDALPEDDRARAAASN